MAVPFRNHVYIILTGLLVFATWIDILIEPWEKSAEFDSELLLFYVFLIQLLLWGWALSFQIYIWDVFSIDHLKIINYKVPLQKTCTITSCFALLVLASYGLAMHKLFDISQEELEFSSFFVFLFVIGMSIYFSCKSISFRWWSWKVLQCLANLFGWPWLGLNFGTTYVGSVLTSSTSLLWHLEMSICFWSVDKPYMEYKDNNVAGNCSKTSLNWNFKPLVYSIPYIIRVLQNLYQWIQSDFQETRRIFSGLKYFIGIIVITLSTLKFYHFSWPLFAAWAFMTGVKTIYSWVWDVRQNWGLLNKSHGYLRKRKHFPNWMYYGAMVFNLFARFAWTVALGPDGWKFPAINLMTAGIEIMRRTIWGILTVEMGTLKAKTNLYGNINADKQSILKLKDDDGLIFSGTMTM